MRKLKFNPEVNQDEVLSRDQLKQIVGGNVDYGFGCKTTPCSLAIQGSDGTWVTRSGDCDQAGILWDAMCYCNVGLGINPVTSNGGVSRCYN